MSDTSKSNYWFYTIYLQNWAIPQEGEIVGDQHEYVSTYNHDLFRVYLDGQVILEVRVDVMSGFSREEARDTSAPTTE